ncbi:cytochrome c maturation protein CcmE [Oleiagrimonas sp.]|jgi:cytochrome c-type biogenesis protein CcmE|uniref:cytochrome c maturation protein CcmE n=1 Tax=Oleiagrimonas sp. TaxID=2010330 RepID=UPI00260DD2E4|nr:cytochrome c maturation protein CcmE [Oleiagrimonas sp.]MDA3914540.1 cytochrome c maturation protein CcmE [Oleiagrimonas sp.]
MNPKRKRRLIITLLVIAAAAVAISLTVFALQQNMNYLYSPTEVDAGKAPAHHQFRLGGVVKEHSVVRDGNSLKVDFVVTDRFHDMPVVYTGILPDLFREGQSVIVTGHMDGNHFVGTEVLAKHDETYMPREVADAIRKAQAAGRAKASHMKDAHGSTPKGGS